MTMINSLGNDHTWVYIKQNMQEQWVHKFNDNFIQNMLRNSIAKMANQKQEIEMGSLQH